MPRSKMWVVIAAVVGLLAPPLMLFVWAEDDVVVKDGAVLAPQKNHLMLPGITYDVILEICRQHGIPCTVRDIAEAEVRAADELLMTSSTREVQPIVRLDGRNIGSGKPGPMAQRIAACYQDFKHAVMYGRA